MALAETSENASAEDEDKRVEPLELFFDLVFVFGLTQVTALMAHDATWEELFHGMLVLAALWWAWGAYAWLTNSIDTTQDRERILMFAAMAAMLVAALAVPDAFGDDGVIFGCAYAAVRWLHIFIFAEANDDVDTAEAVRRLARTAIPAPALLIAAGFLDGTVQELVWILALAIDFSGPFVFGVRGFQVSAGHFAERYSLIVIIALGESIVAIGVGAESIETIGAGVIAAAVLGVVVSAVLWWAYFDVVAIISERRFRALTGDARIRLARDSYSYLHLPMVAGIILVALGMKKTIGHVDEPLKIVPAAALYGGIAMYYLGHVGFRLRNIGTWAPRRVAVAVLLLALIPAATEVDALIALAVAAAIPASVLVYEALRFADARQRLHASH
jgi:low temperature requirement protein LtrA